MVQPPYPEKDARSVARSVAKQIASKGRYGDSMLLHVSRPEVNALAKKGVVTTNPSTGLPEAFAGGFGAPGSSAVFTRGGLGQVGSSGHGPGIGHQSRLEANDIGSGEGIGRSGRMGRMDAGVSGQADAMYGGAGYASGQPPTAAQMWATNAPGYYSVGGPGGPAPVSGDLSPGEWSTLIASQGGTLGGDVFLQGGTGPGGTHGPGFFIQGGYGEPGTVFGSELLGSVAQSISDGIMSVLPSDYSKGTIGSYLGGIGKSLIGHGIHFGASELTGGWDTVLEIGQGMGLVPEGVSLGDFGTHVAGETIIPALGAIAGPIYGAMYDAGALLGGGVGNVAGTVGNVAGTVGSGIGTGLGYFAGPSGIGTSSFPNLGSLGGLGGLSGLGSSLGNLGTPGDFGNFGPLERGILNDMGFPPTAPMGWDGLSGTRKRPRLGRLSNKGGGYGKNMLDRIESDTGNIATGSLFERRDDEGRRVSPDYEDPSPGLFDASRNPWTSREHRPSYMVDTSPEALRQNPNGLPGMLRPTEGDVAVMLEARRTGNYTAPETERWLDQQDPGSGEGRPDPPYIIDPMADLRDFEAFDLYVDLDKFDPAMRWSGEDGLAYFGPTMRHKYGGPPGEVENGSEWENYMSELFKRRG